MASRPGLSGTGIASPYASRGSGTLWGAAALAGAAYGVFLVVTTLQEPPGAELTGRFGLQPAAKALAAVLLVGAALGHPVRRERRWLVAALLSWAAGDYLLTMPWWQPSFVLGLGAFLVAHLCFLAALLPFAGHQSVRVAAAAMVCAALLARLPTPWTALGAVCFAVSDGMIGIDGFVLGSQALAVPIWWTYAASLLLITGGFFFGRDRSASDRSVTPPG